RVLGGVRPRAAADARHAAGAGRDDPRRRLGGAVRARRALHAVHAGRERHRPARDLAPARVERGRAADRGPALRPTRRRGDADPRRRAARGRAAVARPAPARLVAPPRGYGPGMAVDRWALHGIETLRTPGLRELFVVLSAWWLKSAGMLAVAAGADLLARSRLPRATLAGAAAVALGSLCADLLKDATGRHRPPQAEALVHLPHSAAFPSGHATTAFA